MGLMYLYGIVKAASETLPPIVGIDGSSPVRIVGRDGLGCAVSSYRGDAFETLSRERLVRTLLAHQRVVEHVMQRHVVLPVKFGTMLGSSREAIDLLVQGRSAFVDTLALSEDKIEIDVAATWDTDRVLREIGSEDVVVRAREAISGPGRPTVEDRVRLGQLVKASMDTRREEFRDRMVRFLRPVAIDVAAHALVSDELVINVAFLVERARQPELDQRIRALDALFEDGINFRVVGPLPLYSFCTVEVMRLTAEQVDEARQTLHLGGLISEPEVRKAYRRLAVIEQREPMQSNRLVSDELARLRSASDLLLRYCQARNQSPGGGPDRDRHSPPNDPMFKVAIKGSASDEIEAGRFGGLERV